MRALILGLFLLPAVAIAVLSIRPGGLRQQLRYLRRRFKLAMVLAGIYLAASTLTRLFAQNIPQAEWGIVGLAIVLGAVFVVLAQDPQPEPATPPAASESPPPPPPAAP